MRTAVHILSITLIAGLLYGEFGEDPTRVPFVMIKTALFSTVITYLYKAWKYLNSIYFKIKLHEWRLHWLIGWNWWYKRKFSRRKKKVAVRLNSSLNISEEVRIWHDVKRNLEIWEDHICAHQGIMNMYYKQISRLHGYHEEIALLSYVNNLATKAPDTERSMESLKNKLQELEAFIKYTLQEENNRLQEELKLDKRAKSISEILFQLKKLNPSLEHV